MEQFPEAVVVGSKVCLQVRRQCAWPGLRAVVAVVEHSFSGAFQAVLRLADQLPACCPPAQFLSNLMHRPFKQQAVKGGDKVRRLSQGCMQMQRVPTTVGGWRQLVPPLAPQLVVPAGNEHASCCCPVRRLTWAAGTSWSL